MYNVNLYAYCGMRVPYLENETDRATARAEAAALIRRARRRYAVVILERGARWEILEPADSVMVPDNCGELCLTHRTFDCPECGCEHDTRENARACCTDGDWQ